MKMLFDNITKWPLMALGSLAAVAVGCSDIADRQSPFLDRGETIYVGKLDSIVVRGGDNRAVIVGRNTFLRTAKKCLVKWVDINGNAKEQEFDLASAIDGDTTRLIVSPLAEGDYQFFVQTIDAQGNKSLAVECFGASYGDKYKDMQPKIIATKLSMNDDGTSEISLSNSPYATKFDVEYTNTKGQQSVITQTVEEGVSKMVIPDWKEESGSPIKITTYVLPGDKMGIDTIALQANVQVVKLGFANYEVDKSKITPMALTATDDDCKAYGAVGPSGLFDGKYGGGGGESWGSDGNVPGHFCFDIGKKSIISIVEMIGRDGYPGWDVVKFEIWGRESIEDGPDGDTGYKIQSKGSAAGFVDEALQRGWQKVGDGWCKYSKPRQNPQKAKVDLTDVDHSFKPRYIMCRVMSVLTHNVVPVPDDKYYGDEGGYHVNDGIGGSRAFCIGEMSIIAKGTTYTLE